ncbi:hypothetical protein DUI87_26136 [Hirundo rustica rustica]|uniref:MHC class II beta chain N-terminal domain-containing protein n=1 Tax=Hirundo rustica rustica TaxID=333673 RepID=A0A3M0J967_HIRRU|nr:hypothetical protein DUI87_26136 [Hirundo rustica rustica]
MLPGLVGFMLGFVCLGWVSASTAREGEVGGQEHPQPGAAWALQKRFGHFGGNTPDGETLAWDWDRQPECLENRRAQVDTFCCNNYEIMAMSLGLGGPRTPKFA